MAQGFSPTLLFLVKLIHFLNELDVVTASSCLIMRLDAFTLGRYRAPHEAPHDFAAKTTALAREIPLAT